MFSDPLLISEVYFEGFPKIDYEVFTIFLRSVDLRVDAGIGNVPTSLFRNILKLLNNSKFKKLL